MMPLVVRSFKFGALKLQELISIDKFRITLLRLSITNKKPAEAGVE
jgi:hypothetical protein